ncbi:MAG: hypothetical protein O2960_28850 [Verrucomicrobia bacterium]|nr:hypothetical protein [Verrucomicrobiota bacterium]
MNCVSDNSQALAETLLGRVAWMNSQHGYCRCPGAQLHTTANGERDCSVMLDKVPTIFCVHTSCRSAIEHANHELRSAIAKAKINGETTPGKCWRPTAEERKRQQEREAFQRLKLRAEKSLAPILENWATDPVEFFEASPVRLLDDPMNDWRLLLQLFCRADVVWIGDTKDSCDNNADDRRKECCRRHFRTVTDWLKETQVPGQLICPNPFKVGVHSRSNDNLLDQRYLVVESDTLTKPQIAAVFCWCRQFLHLRAIVDTAGKSLHGWFDYPTTDQLDELKNILPQLGCDPALFKASQPVRLPGAKRGEKTQSLLFLDLEDSWHE